MRHDKASNLRMENRLESIHWSAMWLKVRECLFVVGGVVGEMGCVVMNAPVEMQAIKTKYKFNVQEAFACWKPR